jgi:pilus assembly protein CpaF
MALRDRRVGDARRTLTTTDDTILERFRRRLLDEIDLAELSRLDATQRRVRLERVMGLLVSREGPVMSTGARTELIRRVVNEALGLGVLEPLLADRTITEIMVNGADTIYVERFGRIEQVNARFTSNDQLMQTIDRIVAGVNRRVDESSPMVDARLPSGEGVNVVLPPLSLNGPTLTIRRFPRPFSMEELVRRGTLSQPAADLLAAIVRAKLNVVVSGGTGAGKTTMLNALSAFISGSERIITIEDAAELQLQQRHVVSLEARPANIEGAGQVTIRDLVRNALRMRPDRIIIGEVRGGETLDMLQAMNTGHEGSLVTVHANSAEEAVMRLETLAAMSELPIPYEALRDQINSAIDVVVQLQRGVDGTRRLMEIDVVASTHRQDFRLERVLEFAIRVNDPVKGVEGSWVAHPLPESVARRLADAGQPTPAAFRRTSGVTA